MVRFLASLVLAGLILLPAASRAMNEEALLRGAEAAAAGRFEDALLVFDRLAREYPDRPEGPFFRAAVYQFLKGHFELPDYKKGMEESLALAISLAEERMRRDPADARAHFFAGLAHGIRAVEAVSDWNYLSAIAEGQRMVHLLERALALDPGLVDAYYGLGVYRVRMAQVPVMRPLMGASLDEGLGMLRRAAAGGRWMAALARVDLAWALYREERYDEARRELAPLLDRYPRHPLYQLAWAEGYFLARDYPKAREQFSSLQGNLSGKPDRFSHFYGRFAQWRVARCDYAMGRYAEAGVAAREVMDAPDMNSSLLRQVRKGAAAMLDRIEKKNAQLRGGS
ncbi:MAG: tetratricopeptide repeat protein [Candidatus Tectomicrobia bacterium]|uniref:Tetratricopeptide repeat protein n=1 Tax=Tectimicrobiota bacterium TaxID=2528274 RepID=A0A932MP39_UNCTE|nr:tetratricopeptide repeat protein [Candidatus Tectomicrobia bacterium]